MPMLMPQLLALKISRVGFHCCGFLLPSDMPPAKVSPKAKGALARFGIGATGGGKTFDSKAIAQAVMECARNGTLQATIAEAASYASQRVSADVVGANSTCVAPPEKIHEVMRASKQATVTSAASLGMLDLNHNACSAVDVARIIFMFQEHNDSLAFKRAVGTISINYDTIVHGFQKLQRLDKDAEVHALMLLLYYTKDDAIAAECQDLHFEYVRAGTGSKATTYTLSLINAEEKKRQVIGLSAWRRMVFYSDLSAKAAREDRFPESKGEGDRLLKVLQQDGVPDSNLDDNTVKRYLSLGSRIKKHMVLLMTWEACHQRDSLLDNLMNLRNAFGASDNEDDAALILRELFLQQRAGVRKQLQYKNNRKDPRTTANVAKAILLKRNIFSFLAAELPMLADEVSHYSSDEYARTMWGVTPDGIKVADKDQDMSDSDGETDR
ncbi:unnamed protein product, partial [Prorocentrum cordatum]